MSINQLKRVEKPWGHEDWLELNGRYCMKRIVMKAGARSSLQYHEKKYETNVVIEGELELHLENDQGEMEVHHLKAGDHFTVKPPRKHRVVALTDAVHVEASTPEVEDVIRIQDDSGRGDGRIEGEHREGNK